MFKKSLQLSVVVFITYISGSYILVAHNNYGDAEILALISAGILALLNLVLASLFIDKNLSKKQNEFIKSFMRSTVIRLVIVLAIFFTIIAMMPVNHFVFSIGFFILYFLFQMIEIYILHQNQRVGNQ